MCPLDGSGKLTVLQLEAVQFDPKIANSVFAPANMQRSGHIQIHSKGFFRRPTLDGTLPDQGAVEQELKRLGEIRSTVRLNAFALAAGQEVSEGLTMLSC